MPSPKAPNVKRLRSHTLEEPQGVRQRPDGAVATDRLSEWLSFLAAVRGLAPSTLERYGASVRRFLAGVAVSVDRGQVETYLKGRRLQALGDSAIRQELAALRSYCEWAAANGVMAANPTLGIKGPRAYRREAPSLTVEEVKRLLLGGSVTRNPPGVTRDSAKAERVASEPMAMRDRALLALLYFAGLRASEPGRLRVEDVVYEPGTGVYSILIRNAKWSSGDRRVELESVASRLLGVYLPLRGKVASANPWLFPSWRGTPLHRSSVLRMFRQRVHEAGLEARGRKLSPHCLRHSIATHMLADGRFDLRQVQEHLRHADPRTTMRYVHVTAGAVRRAWKVRHPWREVDRSENLAKEAFQAVRGLAGADAT